MLYEHLRSKWHARMRAVPISPAMTFAPQGLVLGAGTILLPAEGARRLTSIRSREASLLALLSAAHGRAVPPSVLGNIERAAKAWSEGDDCLAYIHLAHAGLQSPDEFQAGAYRLLMARCAMMHGASPRAVFEALHLDPRYIDAVEKLYDPDEPRVPAGSGRISGQWTRLLTWIGELSAPEVAELGAYASRLLGPVGAAAAVFGLLFIPSPNNIRVEGEVEGIPGLRYSWNRDEGELHLTYDGPGGAQRTFALYLEGDLVRDEDGRVVGKVIGGNRIAIDTLAVLPDLVKQDEPRLCPAPASDVPGSDRGKSYEENRSRQYEDFLKLLINPPPNGPTPSGFVYYLPNPEDGKPVSFDDCKKTTGMVFEFKGYYGGLLKFESQAVLGFLEQSARQIAASGGRPVVWIFAEKEAAERTRELFDKTNNGRERITIVHVPRIK